MNDHLLSLLSGEEIKELRLVENAGEEFFRASTYDLSVGEIIAAGGKIYGDSEFTLPAGGMIRVVSKEFLRLPNTVTGHVLLKNKLCTRGVLALSIGVVDPGFEGPISSTLINFGRGDFVLEKGTSFLRVSFHRCPESPKAASSEKNNREGYLKRVRQDVRDYSGPMFLNMDVVAADAANRAFVSFRRGLVLWATIVTLLIALLAMFAPLGASYVDRYLTTREQHDAQMEQKIEREVEDKYQTRLNALSAQIEELKQNTAKTGRQNAPAHK
jgi:deoxycytidine triphosphate deaminase